MLYVTTSSEKNALLVHNIYHLLKHAEFVHKVLLVIFTRIKYLFPEKSNKNISSYPSFYPAFIDYSMGVASYGLGTKLGCTAGYQ
jgi:hypothetical protein